MTQERKNLLTDEVLRYLEESGETATVLLFLKNPNFSPEESLTQDKIREQFDHLSANLRECLDQAIKEDEHIKYSPIRIADSIVLTAPVDFIKGLATRDDLEKIFPNYTVTLPPHC